MIDLLEATYAKPPLFPLKFTTWNSNQSISCKHTYPGTATFSPSVRFNGIVSLNSTVAGP